MYIEYRRLKVSAIGPMTWVLASLCWTVISQQREFLVPFGVSLIPVTLTSKWLVQYYIKIPHGRMVSAIVPHWIDIHSEQIYIRA